MKKTVALYLSLGGLIGPIVFTLVTIICASLRTGYSHINQFISELGATTTPHAGLLNYGGLIPFGLMILAFSISVLLLLPASVLAKVGAILISLFGIGIVIAGYFPCDEGCPPRGGSIANLVHIAVPGPAFVSAIIGIFLFAFAFRKLIFWKQFWIYSLVLALVAATFLIVLVNYLESPVFKGLWQRLLLATIFLWLSLTAVKLFKLNQKIDSKYQ